MAVQEDVQKIISDPEMQLARASKEVANWRDGYDTNQLVSFGACKNLG